MKDRVRMGPAVSRPRRRSVSHFGDAPGRAPLVTFGGPLVGLGTRLTCEIRSAARILAGDEYVVIARDAPRWVGALLVRSRAELAAMILTAP
ncbi:MAG: hypothetical protein HYZ29_05005 [Myxococcales bacterium]|nr:hypothetical protein [Myxococcales bacterium]